MILFLKLLIAHFIGDFLLQPSSWVQDKTEKRIKSTRLYLHIGVHAFVLLVLLYFCRDWIEILLLTIAIHFVIDLANVYNQYSINHRFLFFIDQSLHIFVLLVIAQIYQPFLDMIALLSEQFYLLMACLLFITVVSAVAIRVIISKWSPLTGDSKDESLAEAGYYIGILERFFVFIFVILQHWQAVGFLLAAKSVFRFGDLRESRDRKLTEYILIGTLISFGLAMGCGIVYLQLLPTLKGS